MESKFEIILERCYDDIDQLKALMPNTRERERQISRIIDHHKYLLGEEFDKQCIEYKDKVL